MRLRRQLVLVSLLTLSLPWAGCQYIQEMEGALRQGQVVALSATAQAVASRIASEPGLRVQLSDPRWRESAANQLYVHKINFPMQLDGYDDDWRALELAATHYHSDDSLLTASASTSINPPEPPISLSLQVARQHNSLLLFALVEDPHIRYHNPSTGQLASGDHLRLRTQLADGSLRDYVIRSGAPGEVSAFYRDGGASVGPHRIRQEHRILGVWQEHAQGFQLELRVPLSLVGARLGVALVDVGESARVPDMNNLWERYDYPNVKPSQAAERWLGNVQPDSLPPYWSSLSDAMEEAVTVFARDNLRLRVVSMNQWLLADAGSLQASWQASYEQTSDGQAGNDEDSNAQHGLLTWIYRLALGRQNLPSLGVESGTGQLSSVEITHAENGVKASGWYQWGAQRVGQAAVPVMAMNAGQLAEPIAVVTAEQSSDTIMALTNTAFNRLFFYTLLATAVTGIGLLSYASWLSLRIRRLSRAAAEAIDDSGRIRDNFPKSQAADEVGDLTRNYGELLGRLREYTDYLRTLSSKLSHELRTPLAVVRTSLDNLEHEPLSDSARTFSTRAQEGSLRLSNILNAMSSASRVEESIRQAESERFSLSELVSSVGAAYADMIQDRKVRVLIDASASDAWMTGSPDLLVQMLDKLVDNAADFCPPQGEIQLRLAGTLTHWVLLVSNDGPLLPERMQGQLFDSLVSLRPPEYSDDQTHLGLGLNIVRLIVEFHGGEVVARNREDLSGVEFEIQLPKGKHDNGVERG